MSCSNLGRDTQLSWLWVFGDLPRTLHVNIGILLRRDSHIFYTDGGEVVSLTRRPPFPPGIFLVLISVRGWVDPQGHSAAGKIRSIEKSNDLIGNRTRDLPACSIVPQPTTLPRAGNWSFYDYIVMWQQSELLTVSLNKPQTNKHMKSTVFLGITPCSTLKKKRRSAGTNRHQLKNRKMSTTLLATRFQAGFLLGLFFDSEYGGDMFFRNVGWLSTDYTALYPRRY
jgi:hypothetical protein